MGKKKGCCSCCTPVVVVASLVCVGVIFACLGAGSIPLFEDLYNNQVDDQLVLKKGSESYNNWVTPPAPVYMKFHIFNYTNVDDFIHKRNNVTKLSVKEIGPYSYRELRVNEVLKEDGESITYLPNNTYIFDPATSCKGCNENDTLMVVNAAVITVMSMIKDFNITDPGIIKKGAIKFINAIFDADKDVSLFLKLKVHKLIWGYHNPFLGRLSTLESLLNFLKILGIKLPPIDPFVALEYNGTKGAYHEGNMTILTGKSNIDDVMKYTEWRGLPDAPYWRTRWGRMLNGTDGTRFKPKISRDDQLYIFNSDICRSLYVVYDQDETISDVNLYRYTTTDFLFANHTVNPDNIAFCGPKRCWGSGLLPIGQCQTGNPPVFMSAPHFYQGDKSLSDAIIGLHPEKSKHATFVSVEPTTGMTFSGFKRIQINILARPSLWFDVMKPFTKEYNFLPLLWGEETAQIDKADLDKFKKEVLQPKTILKWVSYGLMILGAVIVFAGVIVGVVAKRKSKYKQFENDDNAVSKD